MKFATFLRRIDQNRSVVLKTGDVMNRDAETCLVNLLEKNEERYKKLYKHCLVISDVPITDTIKLKLINSFYLVM